MVIPRVKKKFPRRFTPVLLAVATFLASVAGVFPETVVETTYTQVVFPTISHIVGVAADSVPFSWLDLAIPVGLAVLVYSLRLKRWNLAFGLVSGAYLWFFWTWGINYHRVPLSVRLGLEPAGITALDADQFAENAVHELNRLSPLVRQPSSGDREIATAAARRVRAVVSRIDGQDWAAASRVKRSLLGDGWFRIAGVDGAFNPFGHEPLVASGLLTVELPFVMAHELAHVRGVPDEGDANLIALLATIASDDPVFQYSAWLNLWFYLSTPARDALLDAGPREDLQAIYMRNRSQQIPFVRSVQTTVLDLHLKANDVDEGVASYSRFVALAIATRDRWEQYR
jgi:hypothetical protein